MAPLTTSVTVTYNARKTIDALLQAIEPAHASGELEVYVMDNASADGTEAHVRERYPWVHVHANGGNLGFGRGCNAGFAHVRTKYVLFLNPDAVLPPEGLRTMVDFMESHPRCAIAGPAMVYPGGSQQAAGMGHTPGSVIKSAIGGGLQWAFPSRRVITPGEPPFRTNWVGGACMLVRSDVYREVGMMDPAFFLYFEETDLCRKVLERGHEIWAIGEAVIGHEGGASTREAGGTVVEGHCIAEFYFASRWYYLRKNFGLAPAVAAEIGELAVLTARTVYDRVRGRRRNVLRERLAGPVLRGPKHAEASR